MGMNVPRMNARELLSRILIIVGSIAMLVGALDPMEGAGVIFLGSGLVVLGTFVGQSERCQRAVKTSQ
jgi:Na+/phosphate symporter